MGVLLFYSIDVNAEALRACHTHITIKPIQCLKNLTHSFGIYNACDALIPVENHSVFILFHD